MALLDPILPRRWQLFCLMVVIVTLVNFPVVVVALNSLQTTDDIMAFRSILPRSVSLVNYEFLLSKTAFLRFLWNSVVISGGSTVFAPLWYSIASVASPTWVKRRSEPQPGK